MERLVGKKMTTPPTTKWTGKYAYQKWSISDLFIYVFWKCSTEIGVAWLMFIFGMVFGVMMFL